MPAIPAPPPKKSDPFSVEGKETSETVFVPPIPSSVQPFDDTTLPDTTINEQEAGKEVNVFFKERHEAEMAEGRRLVEKNKKRAQFRPPE